MLSRYGYLADAYALLNRTEFPSWLYPVQHDATTIWERWDGAKPDGSMQDASMNSFNHYAYGAVGEWMYDVMAGINIDPNEPGYKHVLIKPQPGGRLQLCERQPRKSLWANNSAWNRRNGAMQVDVDIPANSHATIELPAAALAVVRESTSRSPSGRDRPCRAAGFARAAGGRVGPVSFQLYGGALNSRRTLFLGRLRERCDRAIERRGRRCDTARVTPDPQSAATQHVRTAMPGPQTIPLYEGAVPGGPALSAETRPEIDEQLGGFMCCAT